MTRAKISHAPIEILQSATGSARVSQSSVEILVAQPTLAITDAVEYAAIGTYGDECNGGSLDAAWTLRNIASVTTTGSAYSTLFDAQGDAITRSFTDPAADFQIACHMKATTAFGGMIGLCALDASGTGIGFSPYSDGSSYIWNITTYAYASTGGSLGGVPAVADFWMNLRRVGTAWSGRYKTNLGNWSSWSNTTTNATTMTQIGIVRAFTSGGNQTVLIERFMYGAPVVAEMPIVSQAPVEILMSTTPAPRVSQSIVEVLFSDASPVAPAGGERSYTYVK